MMAGERYVVQSGNESHAVDVTADGKVTVDGGEPLSVQLVGSGEYEVAAGGRRYRVFAAGPADAREVFVDGRVFRLEVAPDGNRRRARSSAHGEGLTAPMPGTVAKVLVEAGQTVQRGDLLLQLEAMKMELPIRAPHGGTVKTVHCHEGELVQGGAVLLDLSAESAEATNQPTTQNG